MKFKSLLLAAAVTAASFSGAANAAIDSSSTGSTVNSDLVLVIYDAVKDLSYIQNLDNNNFNTILAANGQFSNSFSLDASKLSIFASSNLANLTWSMGAASYNEDDIAHLGTIVTSNSSVVSISDLGNIAQTNIVFGNLATIVNLQTPIGAPTNALAASGAAASLVSNNARLWNSSISTQVDFASSANVSVAQKLWFLGSNDEGVTFAQGASANLWVLDLATNTLSSTPTVVAPVPLPAAAWLMFSALMGLGGIARRRNAKV